MRRSRSNIFSRWDNVVLRLAVACLLLLLISQVLLLQETPRRYLSRVDRLEGEAVDLFALQYAGTPLTITENATVANRLYNLRESKIVIIRMIKPRANRDSFVTVNGQIVGDFRKGDVKANVFDGDYLEIDASQLGEPGQFVVSVPGAGLVSPEDGLLLEGEAGIIPVGKVKFKH